MNYKWNSNYWLLSGIDQLPFQFTWKQLMTLQISMNFQNQTWIQVSCLQNKIYFIFLKNRQKIYLMKNRQKQNFHSRLYLIIPLNFYVVCLKVIPLLNGWWHFSSVYNWLQQCSCRLQCTWIIIIQSINVCIFIFVFWWLMLLFLFFATLLK